MSYEEHTAGAAPLRQPAEEGQRPDLGGMRRREERHVARVGEPELAEHVGGEVGRRHLYRQARYPARPPGRP